MAGFQELRAKMAAARSRFASDNASEYVVETKEERKRPNLARRRQLFAILPVLVTATALVLSILCVYAGHNTTMMQDYPIFTVNTSRIGENMVDKLENKIRDFQLSDIGLRKRAALVVLPATTTAVPTTLITMAPVAPRGLISNIESLGSKATHHIGSDYSSLKSDAASLKSEGASEISLATAYVGSKVNSVESAAAAAASSVVAKIEDEIIKLINDAYYGMIDDFGIDDFYNVHVMASCKGTYEFQNGTNVTVGVSGPPTGNHSVHAQVDSCEQHSDFDVAMDIVKIIYWIGMVHIILALLGSVAAVFSSSRKIAALNFLVTLFAFMALALASAVVHALGLAATKVINFVGSDLGLAAYFGHKFISLTWAATALLAVEIALAIVMFMLDKRWTEERQISKAEKSRSISMDGLPSIHRPAFRES